ncbi:hypothetical protein N7454_002439 [Penicillium verhagenii]|nr:hypothetical protein N7454_002439 [Penicillium verhagenii]
MCTFVSTLSTFVSSLGRASGIRVLKDIIWPANTNPEEVPSTTPQALLVAIEQYCGPTLDSGLDADQRPLVPILPITRDFIVQGKQCIRTQFPIALAYAITVHKSQGVSLDNAVLDIGSREFAPGLRYVTVTRVRTLKGCTFQSPFTFSDLEHRKRSDAMTARFVDRLHRKRQNWNPDTGSLAGIQIPVPLLEPPSVFLSPSRIPVASPSRSQGMSDSTQSTP